MGKITLNNFMKNILYIMVNMYSEYFDFIFTDKSRSLTLITVCDILPVVISTLSLSSLSLCMVHTENYSNLYINK